METLHAREARGEKQSNFRWCREHGEFFSYHAPVRYRLGNATETISQQDFAVNIVPPTASAKVADAPVGPIRKVRPLKSALSHIQFNVKAENVPYYRDLSTFLGWSIIHEHVAHFGIPGSNGESFWFNGEAKPGVENDYDGPGVNHVAIAASSQDDVDALVEYLTEHDIAPRFETPRHRPDFSDSENETYYQVMFESPDRLLFEFVYTGPK